jgi:hypothetical protein
MNVNICQKKVDEASLRVMYLDNLPMISVPAAGTGTSKKTVNSPAAGLSPG